LVFPVGASLDQRGLRANPDSNIRSVAAISEMWRSGYCVVDYAASGQLANERSDTHGVSVVACLLPLTGLLEHTPAIAFYIHVLFHSSC
jgi:hypothetical protein